MGKGQKTMTTMNANDKRKTPVTHKDLALLALMQGVDALDPLLASHTNPVDVLGKVRATFEKNGKDCTALDEKIALWTEIKTPGVKGRKPVKIGDSRSYKAQQIGDDGDLFIRLPVNLLGVSKGQDLRVTFDNGVISVSVAADDQPVSEAAE